jgi:hypothetical protein
VTIGNGGRRPVTIEEVAFIAKGEYLSTPSTWVDQTGFTLEDASRGRCTTRRTALSRRTKFQARDTLGRWWPRGHGLRAAHPSLAHATPHLVAEWGNLGQYEATEVGNSFRGFGVCAGSCGVGGGI